MPNAPEYPSRRPYSSYTGSASAHSSAMHPSSMHASSMDSARASSMERDWSSLESGASWPPDTRSSGSWSALVAGLCAGACAGAALALIFAPMRGSDMRNSVRGYAQDALGQAADVIEQGRRAFRTSAERMSASSDAYTPSQMRAYSTPEPLTASVAEIAGLDRRFEEPLGG